MYGQMKIMISQDLSCYVFHNKNKNKKLVKTITDKDEFLSTMKFPVFYLSLFDCCIFFCYLL